MMQESLSPACSAFAPGQRGQCCRSYRTPPRPLPIPRHLGGGRSWCRGQSSGSGRYHGGLRCGSRDSGGSPTRPAYSPCAPEFGCAERVITRQFHQPVGELVDHQVIPFPPVGRAERVQLGKLRPGIRDHLRRRVQLHMVQEPSGIIAWFSARSLRSESACNFYHLSFAVVAVKDRVRQDRIVATCFLN